MRGGVLLDDGALLNTDTMTWSSLSVQQDNRPGPRRSHAAAGMPGRVCAPLTTAMRAISQVARSTDSNVERQCIAPRLADKLTLERVQCIVTRRSPDITFLTRGQLLHLTSRWLCLEAAVQKASYWPTFGPWTWAKRSGLIFARKPPASPAGLPLALIRCRPLPCVDALLQS